MSSTKPSYSSILDDDRLHELVASADLSRLAKHLDPRLSNSLLARLQQSARLQPRLAALLLGEEVAIGDTDWSEDLLLGHDPRRVALLAGSIWHARSILKMVARRDLSILVELIGSDAHAFAMRHSSKAVVKGPIDDPRQLSTQIEYDGHACLGAWLEQASWLDRMRVFVRLPVGTAADNPLAEHRSAAGPLLSQVIAYLRAEADGV
ncbi:nodulation protein NolU [Bradyrhizobium sp. ORS 285]|uniref:nodulation protein NolU n=1 Tax=Bradyrhizobium sp. ORS 285 TaxID=115808 RepID=UPI001FCB2A58|nr:nodulation protein NolU [Bradyrhizobium sp. ORS 285]